MRLDDDDPQVIFLMAMVLAQRHRFPEAIEMLEEVAETTPQARLPAMGQTADWLVRYGNWVDAEARYLEILKQVPGSVLVHRNLASLLLRQGRRVEALTHLDRLCHLGDVTESELRSMLTVAHPLVGDADDSSFEPIGPLGMARTEIARGDWQAVQNRLQQVDSLGPWESALLGRAYAVLRDLESLRTWIVHADESVNVSPDAWFAKGVYAASAGQHADATRCFAETVLRDPTDRDAYANMAQSLAASKATREADAAEQRAELIEKTQAIGMQMAGRADRDQQDILQLIDLMRQLRRPLEALGWRGVWLTYANASLSISESEVQQVLDEIVRERTVLLEEGQTRAPADFVLCGVNVDALPSRDEVDQRLKSSAL
jgi:tetratricopeptide (TPR) repeat protein